MDHPHRSVKSLRWIPIIAFIVMFYHVIMLCLGFECFVCEVITILFGFYITYIFSKAFQFCFVHRLCIYYAFAVMVCIWLRRFPDGEYGFFGQYIAYARLAMLVLGSALAVLLAYRQLIIKCR